MPVEIQLPDLPEIAIGGPPRPPMPWHLRLRDTLSTYLPLLLMALLAAATWWLVKSTPGAPPERRTQVPPGVADYAMQRFVLQRYAPDGRLTAQLEGRELRHYPENDRIEVDELQLRAWSPDGRLITATARRAVSNGAASELQLQGGAEVIGLDTDGTPVQIRSEFLHAYIETQVVTTSQPVVMKHGGSQVRAAGLHYDGRQRLLEFKGPVRASLQAGR